MLSRTDSIYHRVDRIWAPFYLSVFALVLAIQLFVPPVVGMADNGDNVRLMYFVPIRPTAPDSRFFAYFEPDYLWTGKLEYWPQPFYSGQIAVYLSEAVNHFKTPGHYDLRALGLVHASLFLGCFALLLTALQGTSVLLKWVGAALAIWILGDVFYVAYLNSFYTDTMSFLSLFALLISLFVLFARGAPVWSSLLFAIAGFLLATSKPVHAPDAMLAGGLCLLGCGLVWLRAHPTFHWKLSIAAIAGIYVLLAGAVAMKDTATGYIYPGLMDVVNVRIAVESPKPAAAIAYFGLLPKDLRYAGKTAFETEGPSFDPDFNRRFAATTESKLLRFYITHPSLTLRMLREDLVESTPWIRPPIGNFPSQAGLGRGTLSHQFASWSDWRGTLLRRFPWQLPLIYIAAVVCSLTMLAHPKWRRHAAFAWLLLLLAMLGCAAFVAASLFDAIETARHLFFFHAVTDSILYLLFCALLYLASSIRVSLRKTVP